jgi:predicted glycoside hydrolase/deacetylase ChbG (UPF0249 family)
MTRRLIVNADDFGLTGACRHPLGDHHGIVTSTTLLATAAIDAEQLAALRDSGLGVGIHVNLRSAPLQRTPLVAPRRCGREQAVLLKGWIHT